MRRTSYAIGTVRNTAESPSDAARMWNTNPVVVPASETIPAARPWHSVRETRYSRFGPGVSTSRTLATTKSRKLSSVGIGVLAELDRHCGGFASADAQARDAALLAVLAQRAQERRDD